MKRRVLIFALTYHPFVGGAEVAIKEITDRLTDIEFHMITLRFDSGLPLLEKSGNILIHRIGPSLPNPPVSDRNMPFVLRAAKMLFPILAFIKALALSRRYAYDATWAMMANHAGFAALLYKYALPRVPYILELQDGRALEDMKTRQPILRLMWPLYVSLYRKADAIKAISEFLARQVRTLNVAAPVHVIPNGVDVAKFSAPVPDYVITGLKQQYGKEAGDVFLFTASRLVLSRGVEDTIRALSYLPENVKLLIAGSGDDKDKLQAIANEINVSNRVIFAGHIDHAQLPAMYRMCDIFVRPSVIEGFGNAFVEAFAAGIPVVATPVGGIPDFLFDPHKNPDKPPTGLFCEVGNAESVAKAVRAYMNDPALVARVVSNARALVSEKYDWNSVATLQKKLLFELFFSGDNATSQSS